MTISHHHKIRNKSPLLHKMREKGYMPVDMHIHTHYSDAAIRIPSLLTRANHLGIGVAITDHNEIGFFLSTNTIVITKKISAINNIGNRK